MASTENIVALLTSVTAYCGQFAPVLHDYRYDSYFLQSEFEGKVYVIDTAVVTLRKVLGLVKDHVEHGKNLFSPQGIEYTQLLAVECGHTLFSIESKTAEGCLAREARKALKKKQKETPPSVLTVTDLIDLSLDEKSFQDTLEKGIEAWENLDVEESIDRLSDLQLRLLLVYQVVTVAALSKDVSSGKVDIQSIVSYHNRIKRTADLADVWIPTGPRRRQSFCGTDNSASSYYSDSDESSIIIASSRARTPKGRDEGSRPKRRTLGHAPPPPPPRLPNYQVVGPPWKGPFGPPPPPPANWPAPGRSNSRPLEPGYCAPSLPMDSPVPRPVPGPGPGLCPGPPPPLNLCPGPIIASFPPSMQQGSPPAYADRPSVSPSEKDSTKDGQDVGVRPSVKSSTHEARLFKSQPKGLAFKLKRIFRSKESLAGEMKRTLSDTESHLIAYIIQVDGFKEIPHSAFHSLEATHMKTILSQLHDDTWYKTFVTLNADEHYYLRKILCTTTEGKVPEREVIVLKMLREEKYSAEMKLLNWVPRIQLYSNRPDDRTVLAIVREKLIDGKPMMRDPPHTSPSHPSPVTATSNPPTPGDHELRESLTSFAEYTIRFRDHHANGGRSLAPILERVHNDQSVIRQRVQAFERQGGNVISVTLLMTDRQSEQANLLMREIRRHEQDHQFEWHWAELSLHNGLGEITKFGRACNIAEAANVLHLIAKRTLRPTVHPADARIALKYGPPPGFYPSHPPSVLGPPIPPPGPPFPPPPPRPVTVNCLPPKPRCPPVVPPTRPGQRPVRRSDVSSDSESSDSTVSRSRSRSGKGRRRRAAKRSRANRGYNDSDSDTPSELHEDRVKIDLQLKGGDDIVMKLLELWTPQASNKESA